jgi:hypothetical protein
MTASFNANTDIRKVVFTVLPNEAGDILLEMIRRKGKDHNELIVAQDGKIVDIVSKFQDPETGITYIPVSGSENEEWNMSVPDDIDLSVRPESLRSNIQDFLSSYMDIETDDLNLATAYTIHSGLFDAFDKVPLLRIQGTFGSGKSRFTNLLRRISLHGLNLGEAVSEAVIFRVGRMYPGCLMTMDEFNFSNTHNTSRMVQILNGSTSKFGKVARTNLNRDSVDCNVTFSPKIIASNSSFSDAAFESRLLEIFLTRTSRRDIPCNLSEKEIRKKTTEILNQNLSNRIINFHTVNPSATFDEMSDISHRTQELITPIVIGQKYSTLPEWFMRIVRSKEKYLKEISSHGLDAMVASEVLRMDANGKRSFYLEDIAKILNKHSGTISNIAIGNQIRQLKIETDHRRKGTMVIVYDDNIDYLTKHYPQD